MTNKEQTTIEIAKQLNDACKMLGAIDVKYLPSPKSGLATDIKEMTTHATSMMNNYRKFLDGDINSGVKELIIEE